MDNHRDTEHLQKLLDIMATLRDPERGCPWDVAQTFETIAPYTLEEAYEVVDAIERGDPGELADELGDLLLQVVFHARMAEEAGLFSFADVARRIGEKMERRHPHVFGDAPRSAGGSPETWEALKRAEKPATDSVLDGIPVAMPALSRAMKLGQRAARVGFDWPDATGPRAKIDEELAELDEAMASGNASRVRAELGDVLFAIANLCRHVGVDAEQAGRGTNRRFEARFRHVEAQVRQSGRGFDAHTHDELEAFWEQAKREERGDGPDGERGAEPGDEPGRG